MIYSQIRYKRSVKNMYPATFENVYSIHKTSSSEIMVSNIFSYGSFLVLFGKNGVGKSQFLRSVSESITNYQDMYGALYNVGILLGNNFFYNIIRYSNLTSFVIWEPMFSYSFFRNLFCYKNIFRYYYHSHKLSNNIFKENILSSGQFQYKIFILANCIVSSLCHLDEPFLAMDSHRHLKKKGEVIRDIITNKTTLFVDHNIQCWTRYSIILE